MAEPLYITVITVSTDGGVERPLLCKSYPSRQEVRLLYVLGEHVSRTLAMDDICYRLDASVNAVRIAATKLRRRLHHDWAVQSINSVGMRLCYIGSDLADADRTYASINTEAFRPPYRHPPEIIEKIRAAAVRSRASAIAIKRRVV